MVARIPTATQVVAAALIDRDGCVLMQQRSADRQHGGLWEFPGGKLEAGETDMNALCREIDEELGITLAPAALDFLAEAHDPAARLVIRLYTCRVWQGDPRCLDAAALGWFSPAAILELEMPPLDRPLAQALRSALEKS